MKKTSSTAAKKKTGELEKFDARKIDPKKFKRDITANELKVIASLKFDPSLFPSLFGNVETLSATKTLGRGRTNLTFIRPTIVQVDATVPSATFDIAVSPDRKPAIQMHFEPSAYGIGFVATYFMAFSIQVFGQATFRLDGSFGGISNPGIRVLTGPNTVTAIFKDLAPTQQVFAFLEQQSGSAWSWFSANVSFPPLVIVS